MQLVLLTLAFLKYSLVKGDFSASLVEVETSVSTEVKVYFLWSDIGS
jgi:hypothetical protein